MSSLELTMYRLGQWAKSPRPYLMLIGFALLLVVERSASLSSLPRFEGEWETVEQESDMPGLEGSGARNRNEGGAEAYAYPRCRVGSGICDACRELRQERPRATRPDHAFAVRHTDIPAIPSPMH